MKQERTEREHSSLKKFIISKRWRKAVSILSCVVVFVTTYALILPAITIEKNASCGIAEHPGHSMEAGCYEVVKNLTCGLEEHAGHTHGSDCYETVSHLICGLEESEEHSHDENCYSREQHLVCGQTESEGHTHGDGCYTTEERLICQKIIHSHTDACFRKDAPEGDDSGNAEKTENGDKTEIANQDSSSVKPETNAEETESDDSSDDKIAGDVKADLESSSNWEKTLKDVKLTGYWDKDIVAIAESQLGYHESTKNYALNEKGKKKGYTRYGQWYGDPYGDWCAMFVSFCLNYAEIGSDAMPREGNCQRWIDILKGHKKLNYYEPEDYTPKKGDLVFFDWDKVVKDKARHSDHIGIVAEVITNWRGDVSKIKTIEGNASDQVKYVTYDIDNSKIMGYGELPINPKKADEAIVKTFEGKDYVVTVTYPRKSKVSEDAELIAKEYKKNSKEYKSRYEEAALYYGWGEDEDYTGLYRIFNIGLFQYNQEIEPDGDVNVVITYKTEKKNKKKQKGTTQITHYADDRIETIDAHQDYEGEDQVIDFVTGSFSDYGVMGLADEDYGISLLSAADSEANLIAYFTFDNDGRGDSSGNGATITFHGNEQYGFTTLAPGYTTNDGIANPRSLKLAYATNSTNAYKTYVTIAKSNGQSLLTGYDEISFDFWIYPEAKDTSTTGDTANGWPFAVMKSDTERTYLGMYNSANGSRFQTEKVYNGNYGGSASIANQDLNNKWTHVRIDFSDTEITETLWDANGNLIRTVTTPNTNPIADVLGSNSSVVIGGNTYYKEYFNGYIDEFKIYASGSSNNGQQTGSDYHVCRSDEIAHASFDNNTVTREETGKATITNYGAEVTTNSNIFAPVPVKQGNTKGAGLFWHTQNDYIEITGKNNQTLIKGHGYNQFELDFWARPQSLAANTKYGLFTVGSHISATDSTKRYLTAYIDGSDPTKVYLRSTNNGRITTIQCSQSVSNTMLHYVMLYQNGKATLYILDADDNVIGSGNVDTAGFSALFANDEVVRFGVDADGNSFNGRLDEVMVTARNFSQTVADGTRHPASAKTGDLHSTGVYLLNVDLSAGNEGNPLAGVSYSIWSGTDTSGRPLGTYTTNDLYMLNVPEGVLAPGQTYTIKQVGVPEGYIVAEQTKTFTVNNSNGDSLTEIGVFYDYKPGEGYEPDKKAEVVDYENRIYDIILSAKSGAVTPKIQKKKFLFVVDQSNSMLFPAKLESTGATVTLFHDNVPGYDVNLQAGGNSARMDAALAEKNLDPSKLYYIICKENTTATAYVLYRSSNGDWYYQDASYYAQVQNSNVTGYEYADVGSENNTRSKGGGGDLNGTNRVSENKGFSLVGTLGEDIAGSGVPAGIAGTKKTYTIYQAGMDNGQVYNRLTYLKYAIKRMVYELAEMDSQNEVTIVGFDKTIEGCITREVDKSHPDNVADLIKFVDDIDTTDQTSQNYGLWHIMGRNPADMKDVEHSATYNHLADGTNAYVVLITDGALNCPGNTIENGVTQREDLYRAATAIRNTGAGLITIGLSVQNVTEAQTDLASVNEGGIASPGMSFLDMDADELSNYLTNTLLGRLMEFESVESTATIRDYISESFYLVDQDGSNLNVGDWLTLEGVRVPANDSRAAGQVQKDSKGWYVEWKDQLLGLGTEGTPEIPGTAGSLVTTYVYTDSTDYCSDTVLETSKIYYINPHWHNHLIGTGEYDTNQSMLLYRNDRWVYEFASNVWQPEHTDPYEYITTSTVGTPGTPTIPGTPGSPVWHGKIFVKAKEDFIGGNTIDTNKYDATITLKNSDDSSGGTISLETPTVNVRLLPINHVSSEETVFLGDGIDVKEKVKALFDQLYITKILTNGDDIHNKYPSYDPKQPNANAEGLMDDRFTLGYAADLLTDAQWQELLAGNPVTVAYNYDDASSHGDVGYFTITLTRGENDSFNPHQASETGLEVETYTLNVDYTAYRITGGGELDQREDDVHNYGNGPGWEVGKPGTADDPHDTLETGKGTLESENIHKVHVVDGEVTVIKQIDESLQDAENDQTFEFTLYEQRTTGSGENQKTEFVPVTDGENGNVTLNVIVEKGQLSGSNTLEHLKRGTYKLVETDSTDYHVDEMNTVEDDTNCSHEQISAIEINFTIGTDEENHDVIIWNTADGYLPVYSYLSGTSYVPGSSEACEGVSFETAIVRNTKTDREIDLPIVKRWHQVGESDYQNLDVYVSLYRGDSPILDPSGKLQVVKLNAANNWSGAFSIALPEDGTDVSTLGYSVRELHKVSSETFRDANEAIVINETVTDAQGEQIHPSVYYVDDLSDGIVQIGEQAFAVSVGNNKADGTAGENDPFTLVVTNAKAYKLPITGGMGTTSFTLGGLLLMAFSLLYGFSLRRKRERRLE